MTKEIAGLVSELQRYGNPESRGKNHPQNIACRKAADALLSLSARIREMEAKLDDAGDLAIMRKTRE